jgi:hypothetical protein
MADAEDSKSSVRKHMRVQVPPSAHSKFPSEIKWFIGKWSDQMQRVETR